MITKQELMDLTDEDAADAAALERATGALSPGKTELPAQFNQALRQRLAQPATRPRRHLKFPALLGYAAMLAAGVLLGAALVSDKSHVDPLGASVSWAQVVQAVERVEYFHATFIADEPRNSGDRPTFYRIDWFYQRPGTWRAQGLDFVQFGSGNERRMYSIKEGAWTPPENSKVNLLRHDLGRDIPKADLLTMALSFVFNGEAPAGEPVKNADLAASGIEVFDYAPKGDPGADWARIWVLKESKMPLRMQVFIPSRDGSLLIEFDYTDPQPKPFFDPQSFDAGLEQLKRTGLGTNRTRIYGIGTEPVGGTKARAAAQIYDAAGGYHAPQFRRILSNTEGDIALVTSTPTNRNPNGSTSFHEGFEDITDTWGNRYLLASFVRGNRPDDDCRWYFTPVNTPLKTGPAPRRLTFHYALETLDNGWPARRNQTLATETRDIPDASIPGMPDDWKVPDLADAKLTARRVHLRETAPLSVQLAAVEEALARNPADEEDLRWKISLYRQFGREEQAWKFFESHMLNRLLTDEAFFYGYENNRVLASYLVYLAQASRTAEFDRIHTRLQEIRAKGLASANHAVQRRAQDTFESDGSPMAQVIRLPEWRTLIREHPPQVIGVQFAKDGMVCVQFRVPLQPALWRPSGQSAGDHWRIDYGWFWTPIPQSPGWNITGQYADTATGEIWIALAPTGNDRPGTVTLGQSVQLVPPIGTLIDGEQPPLMQPWAITATLPAASIDAMERWWTARTSGKNAWWNGTRPAPAPAKDENHPVDQWLQQASDLKTSGQSDVALALYRRIAAAPDDQWPADYRDPTMPAGYLDNTRQWARAQVATLHAQSAHLDEARKESAALRATLPASPDLRDPSDITARRNSRIADLAIVRALMAAKQFSEAQKALAAMEADRPDLAAIPDEQINLSRQPGLFQMRSLRQLHRDAWRDFDQTWWDLHDATAKNP